mgnify:CR=1 FL=1
MEDKPLEISFSKFKLSFMFIVALIFVAISIYYILPAYFSLTIGRGSTAFLLIMGILGLVFFGSSGFYLAKKIYNSAPGIILSKKGITDNSGILSVGFVEWEDIVEICDVAASKQIFINIVVKDPDKYISRQSNGLKRKWMQINYKAYGTVIAITSTSLTCTHAELSHLLKQKFSQFKGLL